MVDDFVFTVHEQSATRDDRGTRVFTRRAGGRVEWAAKMGEEKGSSRNVLG